MPGPIIVRLLIEENWSLEFVIDIEQLLLLKFLFNFWVNKELKQKHKASYWKIINKWRNLRNYICLSFLQYLLNHLLLYKILISFGKGNFMNLINIILIILQYLNKDFTDYIVIIIVITLINNYLNFHRNFLKIQLNNNLSLHMLVNWGLTPLIWLD